MRTPSLTRFLLPTLGALLLGLTWGAPAAHAAGNSTTSSALQVAVEVVRSCSIDSTAARTAGPFDATGREQLVRATQSSLAFSCNASQTRVTVSDVQLNLVGPSGTMPRLDVEF